MYARWRWRSWASHRDRPFATRVGQSAHGWRGLDVKIPPAVPRYQGTVCRLSDRPRYRPPPPAWNHRGPWPTHTTTRSAPRCPPCRTGRTSRFSSPSVPRRTEPEIPPLILNGTVLSTCATTESGHTCAISADENSPFMDQANYASHLSSSIHH